MKSAAEQTEILIQTGENKEIKEGNKEKTAAGSGIARLLHRLSTGVVLALLAGTILFVIGFLSGFQIYIVKSGSMEPAISTGSLCIINTQSAYEAVQTGDIIAYESASGGMVLHRAVSVQDEGIETKGDANEISDGVAVTAENYAGSAMFWIPQAGFLAAFLQTKRGLILAVSILAALILAGVMADLLVPKRCADSGAARQRRNPFPSSDHF